MLTYLGVWSLGLFSPTFFSTSSKKKNYLPDREASWIKKEYCRCGPHPLQVTSSRARPYLLRERAALAPFSQNSGVGHSGLWPPLHCGDSKHLAPEVVPGASLHSEALSPECGRECPGTGDCGPTRHVGAGLWGLLLADCSWVARAMTPRPPPQPHGWVRLRFEVSRFPDFWRGDGMC